MNDVKVKRIAWMAKRIALSFLWLLIPSAISVFGARGGVTIGGGMTIILYAPFCYLVYRTAHGGFSSEEEKADMERRKEQKKVETQPATQKTMQENVDETTNCTELLMGLQSVEKAEKKPNKTALYYVIVALSCVLLLTFLIFIERERADRAELSVVQTQLSVLEEKYRACSLRLGEQKKRNYALVDSNRECEDEIYFWERNCVLFNPNSKIYHKYGCSYLGEDFRLMWTDAAINRHFTACAKCYPFNGG